MARVGRKQRIEVTKETTDEYRLWSKSRRARFVDMVVSRAMEAMADSAKSSPRDKMSIARQASEVLDKLCGADLKELQREEILRKLAAGVLGMGSEASRPIINIVYPSDPAEPPAGGGTPGAPAG